MNRRIRDPYVRWCGRSEGVTPPPTRLEFIMERISVKTRKHCEFIDITPGVQDIVHKSGVTSGVCQVFVPHTTAGITINENADPDVIRDIVAELNKMVPLDDNYAHAEGNSAAHIKSSMVGCSQAVLIEEGRLALGEFEQHADRARTQVAQRDEPVHVGAEPRCSRLQVPGERRFDPVGIDGMVENASRHGRADPLRLKGLLHGVGGGACGHDECLP